MTKAAIHRAAIAVAGKLTASGKGLQSKPPKEIFDCSNPLFSRVLRFFEKVGTPTAYGKMKNNFYAFMNEGLDVRREISWH